MATVSAVRPLSTDPLRSFKFNVVIPYQSSALTRSEAVLGFMSVTGLGIAVQPLTYREGGDNLTTRKMPGQADFNPITLSRGLFPGDRDNWDWMSNIFTAMYGGGVPPSAGTSGPLDFRTYAYINVLDHPNNGSGVPGPYQYGSYPAQNSIVKISFKLYSVWIGSLAYSDMDAGSNAVGIEQMTLNYEGFDMQWGGSGYVANPTSW